MDNIKAIIDRIASLEACSTTFEFPAGGNVPIPLQSESALLDVLNKETPITSEELSTARTMISRNECYGSVIFAVRMGILAVRENSAELFRKGLRGLWFDSGQVDYRDLLGVFSILELCSRQLGLDYDCELANVIDRLDEHTRATAEGYLARPEDMRNIEVMGFRAEHTNDGLYISSRD